MKEEIHPFVEDVVRWFDADICKLRPELRSVAFIDRVGILLAFLASVDVAAKTIDSDGALKWQPQLSIRNLIKGRRIQGAAKINISTAIILTPLVSGYERELRRQWFLHGDDVVERTIATFSKYAKGYTEVVGKDENGILRWTFSEQAMKRMKRLKTKKGRHRAV
jgi:hypothetical protein